jgi:hypothetical protein
MTLELPQVPLPDWYWYKASSCTNSYQTGKVLATSVNTNVDTMCKPIYIYIYTIPTLETTSVWHPGYQLEYIWWVSLGVIFEMVSKVLDIIQCDIRHFDS